ncbi:MAG: acylphosphatase [Nitrososphaerales archaeon]|nr:acylphosphatase [Nitrososphaerales archaeon]
MRQSKVAVKVRISGLVHGVFFRASMAEVAKLSGVNGWVTNMTDGSVEAILEGEQDSVNKVVEWARLGPPKARVDSVAVEPVKVRNLRGFRISG